MAHMVETMFSVKETPWHRLGAVVQEAPTAAEAIRLAGLDWEVGLETLRLADGREAPARATVRRSDGRLLGVVGPRWHPLQNADAFRWFDPFIEAGECQFETAGSLDGGRRVWVLAALNRAPAEVAPGDAVRKFLLLSNSHDGSLAVRVGFTPVRVVCANTLAMAHGDADSRLLRLRHTRSLPEALAQVREVVNAADAAFEATADQYRPLALSRVVNRADLRAYVKRVLELTEKEDGQLCTRSANVLAAVLENFDGSGKGSQLPGSAGTWWGAYNAVTEYLSYTRGRTEDTRLNALWFGEGARANQRALELALAQAI